MTTKEPQPIPAPEPYNPATNAHWVEIRRMADEDQGLPPTLYDLGRAQRGPVATKQAPVAPSQEPSA